jgi:hypothetical protein
MRRILRFTGHFIMHSPKALVMGGLHVVRNEDFTSEPNIGFSKLLERRLTTFKVSKVR